MLNLIFDLDNTIYPVASIGDKLFGPLFDLLARPGYGLDASTLEKARQEIMRRPFQKVAGELRFPPELTAASLNLLRNMTFEHPMECFEDYQAVRQIPLPKFLVTTGFRKLQESKISRLRIRGNFREIRIIDPDSSPLTKKDVFLEIMRKYQLDPGEIVVVGDDPDSEIRGASELGIRTFLLDPADSYQEAVCTWRGRRLRELIPYLEQAGLLRSERNERS